MNLTRHSRLVSVASMIALAAPLLIVGSPGFSAVQDDLQRDRIATNETTDGAEYVAGELLVTFEEQVSSRAVSTLIDETGAETEPVVPEQGIKLLAFPKVKARETEDQQAQTLESVKQELEQDPSVAEVGYNYVVYPRFKPNDSLYKRQYGLREIRAPSAWSVTLGKGARIGIIDSGVQASHPDLKGKVVAQRDFYSGDGVAEDSKAEDEAGHGTAVAGIATANTDNARGVAGVCPKCTLVVGKFLGPNGEGTIADSIKAMDFAVDNGAKVLNLSYGYVGRNSPQEQAFIERAWNRGVFVAAAVYEGYPPGYFGKERDYPAAYEWVAAVSATDESGKKATFANRGSYIDLTAPGVGILSTDNTNSYGLNYGTSFSTPHVAGVAGLLAGQGLSNERIRERVECSARDLGRRGRDDLYGEGLLDAYAAVTSKCESSPPPQPADCTVAGTEGNDALFGTRGRDVICGRGGNDTVRGYGGEDALIGGVGEDDLYGGIGEDALTGGPGSDLLIGGLDKDAHVGGDGNDRLDGRDGDGGDVLNGGTGTDTCTANQGDTISRCP